MTRRPVATLTADPLSGRPGDQISLSAAGSADPDGGPLTYAWSYTGAATCDGPPGASDHTTVTFLTFGTKRVTVCAVDADGAIGIAYATIAIVNDPPATTDVFSVFDGQFNRTVSANLRDVLQHLQRPCRSRTGEHHAMGALLD